MRQNGELSPCGNAEVESPVGAETALQGRLIRESAGVEPYELLEDEGDSLVVFCVDDSLSLLRLDALVAQELGISRAYATKLIRKGAVSLDPPMNAMKPSIKCPPETHVRVRLPKPEETDMEPEDVPFDVLYEDPDFLVIDKPSGIVVHPAPGNWTGTLVHGLLFRYGDFGKLSGARRPGIVHRLDAGTSGLMVIARNQWAHERLSLAFKKRFVGKDYLALVWRTVPWETREVHLPIGRDPCNRVRMSVHPEGREAHTTFRVLRRFRKATLLACRLHTGRTHQIRVHASAIGHPLVGDTLYGPGYPLFPEVERIFLHAWKLRFPHPRTWEEIGFRSCLPQELVAMLRVFDATIRG